MSASFTFGAPSPTTTTPAEDAWTVRKKQKTSHLLLHDEVIDLTGPDPPRINSTIDINDDDDDDEVQIVDPPPKVTLVNKSDDGRGVVGAHHHHHDAGHDDDEDIQVTGTVNAMRLPHMRPHCTDHPFVVNSTASNSQSCDLCYCYVCDAPVKECKEWSLHCNATDKGPMSYCWNAMRRSTQASATIVKAHSAHGKLFKNMFHTIGKIVKTVCLEFDQAAGTMQCQAMDMKHNTTVSVKLRASFFETFECNEKKCLHVNVADVKRALKHVKNASHGIVLRATSSVLTITVKDYKTGEDVSSPEPVPLFQSRSKARLLVPELRDYACTAQLPAAEFKRIMGSLFDKGKYQTCIIAAEAHGPGVISFSRLASTNRESDDLSFSFACLPSKRPLQVRFDCRLLFDLTRPPPLARNIHLSLSPGTITQMKVAYKLEDENNAECLGDFEMYICKRRQDND